MTAQVKLSNPSAILADLKGGLNPKTNWIAENTAILVVHGIGDQVPLATLDDFARGFVRAYRDMGVKLKLRHELMAKDDNGKVWFDNVLRIKNEDSEHYIDIYEYYWANYTEDKASWDDLNKWLQGVVDGAKTFYKKNGALGQEYKDKSIFFDKKTGEFNSGIYQVFISGIAKFFMAFDMTLEFLIKAVGFIPFMGGIASKLLEKLSGTFIHNLTNVIGDVAIYNVVDPKSKFYCVRSQIADGAIGALRYLVEKTTDTAKLHDLEDDLKNKRITAADYDKGLKKLEAYYPSVIVAGHSLGSQVAYDSVNKLNLLLNEGNIKTYTNKAVSKLKHGTTIDKQLKGFITFGSPLDKIIFFLRENVPDNNYIRQQIVNHYHGFKLRPVDHHNNELTNNEYVKADCGLERYLENIQWRNYYDNKDYVSGGLDYYTGLTNVDCHFKAKKIDFTHSNYWDCPDFYRDIIVHYLSLPKTDSF